MKRTDGVVKERKERGDRLKHARRDAGWGSASQAAMWLQVPTTTYESHERGRVGFGNFLDKYATAYKVNILWLWSGKGPMKQSQIVEKFDQLSPRKQALLLALADSWIQD